MSESTERVELSFESDASSTMWSVQSAQLREQLNNPYRLLIRLATDDLEGEPVLLLGQPATLTITRGSMMRRVTGIVSEVMEGSTHPEMVTTAIVVVPAFEALRHRVNTKIFQGKTVPEILDEVLGEGLGAYNRSLDDRTARTYPTCDYRVQYDESDYFFCTRLMEEEGIAYWFEFDGDAETLVLADSKDSYGEIRSLHDSMLLYSTSEGGVEGHEYVTRFDMMSQLRPTKVVTRHFDWTHPSAPIEGDSSGSDPGPAYDFTAGAYVEPEREVYQHDEQPLTLHQYDGQAHGANDVDDQVRLRREAQAWEARVAQGESTVTGITAGSILELMGHPRTDLDGRYLAIGVTHRFDDHGRFYRNTFQAIPADVPYRPKRLTPKPRIESIQTATVVGPAGEEIHTDNHGRIKVQFHWDRLGANDEHSSCWVRVRQPWAGAGWGFVFIPRIGMEVVVDFVNGEPGQPVVIGCVYNGEHPPPYALPDEKTKSTIKTETSLGGGGFNEIRFEDKAGSEEIFTHAQKDQNEVVENDHTTTVHHDQMIRVDNDQTQEVGNDQTEHVFNNQSLEVDANRTVQVHGNYDETIDGTETRQVTGDVSETFSANETRAVSANMDETISGSRTQTITGNSTESITGSLTQTITGGATITTPATYDITATNGFNVTTPATSTITASGGFNIASTTTTMHDADLSNIGQFFKYFYSEHMSVCLFKIELILTAAFTIYGAISYEHRGFHAELIPTINKKFLFKKKTFGAKAKTTATENTSGGIKGNP
jgi:type VI secretion system secreted protein VgrG